MISFLIVILGLVFVINSQLVCEDAFQCVNETMTFPANVTLFNVDGYKSAFGSFTSVNITPSNNTDAFKFNCIGSHSCESMAFIEINRENTDLLCHGTASCSKTTILSSKTRIDDLFCYAPNSCSFSSIRNVGLIACDGETSCAHSNITSTDSVRGYGLYALYRSIIDSENVSKLTVNLNGKLAGYGAQIICVTGTSCDINCNGYDSCFMMYLQCDNNCNIILSSNAVIEPITDYSNIVIDTVFLRQNDELCNTHPLSITFDNSDENFDNIITINDTNGTPICCRADQSCRKNEIEYISKSASTSPFICSSGTSCTLTTFDANNATLYCEGTSACRHSNIRNASRLYCTGYGSCQDSVIRSTSYILFSGTNSNRESTIYSGGVDVYIHLDAVFSSDRKLKIYCNESDYCNIICSGFESCLSIELFCSGNCATYNITNGWPLTKTDIPTTSTAITASTVPPILIRTSTMATYYVHTQTTAIDHINIYTTETIQIDTKPSTNMGIESMEVNEEQRTAFNMTYTHIKPLKKSDIKLMIILTISSVSSLTIIGCIIWYWIQFRREKKKIFENNAQQMNIQNNIESTANNASIDTNKYNATNTGGNDDILGNTKGSKHSAEQKEDPIDEDEEAIDIIYDPNQCNATTTGGNGERTLDNAKCSKHSAKQKEEWIDEDEESSDSMYVVVGGTKGGTTKTDGEEEERVKNTNGNTQTNGTLTIE